MGKLKKLSAANRIETKIKYFQIVSIYFGGECFWRIGNAFWLATIMMWAKLLKNGKVLVGTCIHMLVLEMQL
jgi:hypothetical protein